MKNKQCERHQNNVSIWQKWIQYQKPENKGSKEWGETHTKTKGIKQIKVTNPLFGFREIKEIDA